MDQESLDLNTRSTIPEHKAWQEPSAASSTSITSSAEIAGRRKRGGLVSVSSERRSMTASTAVGENGEAEFGSERFARRICLSVLNSEGFGISRLEHRQFFAKNHVSPALSP